MFIKCRSYKNLSSNQEYLNQHKNKQIDLQPCDEHLILQIDSDEHASISDFRYDIF